MMLNQRKKLRLQLAPSDRQLWAIGVVAVQWSQFEMWVQIIGQTLLEGRAGELDKFNSNRSVKGRIEVCESEVAGQLSDGARATLLGLFRRAKDLQDQRDKIVHNQWTGAPDEEAKAVFNWAPPHPQFEWKLDFGRVMAVASGIDGLNAGIAELVISASPDKTLGGLVRSMRRPAS